MPKPSLAGEPPTTASGRSIVGGEVNRNERAPQCGAATIEVADGIVTEILDAGAC